MTHEAGRRRSLCNRTGASGREPLAPLVFRGPLIADGSGGQPAPGSRYFARTAFAWRSSGRSPSAGSHSATARPYSVLAFAALPDSSAARAAELSGNAAKARTLYGRAVALCDPADGERPELRHAKAVLAK